MPLNATQGKNMMRKILHVLFFCLPALVMAQDGLELEWVREYSGDFEMQDARAIALELL